MVDQKSISGFSIASLILSLLGFIPIIPSILALIFGIIAIKKTKVDPNLSENGKIVAIIGIVLSILGLLFWLLVIFLILWGAPLFSKTVAQTVQK